jgi:hypothetical protein
LALPGIGGVRYRLCIWDHGRSAQTMAQLGTNAGKPSLISSPECRRYKTTTIFEHRCYNTYPGGNIHGNRVISDNEKHSDV